MSELKDDLTDIQGVGDATADKVIQVLNEHDAGDDPYLEKAKKAAAMNDDRSAAVYLRRASE